MLAVSLAIKLVIIMVVGFFAIKSNILQESFTAQLNTFVMKIALPAMIFNSISSAPAFTADTLSNCLIIMAASAAVMFISLGIGELFYAKMGKSGMNAVKSTPVRVISAEEVLKGREITEETAEEAVTAGFKETEVLADNEYKITLAKVMLKRAILA